MRALKIFEYSNFKRGDDPYASLNIGDYKLPEDGTQYEVLENIRWDGRNWIEGLNIHNNFVHLKKYWIITYKDEDDEVDMDLGIIKIEWHNDWTYISLEDLRNKKWFQKI